MKKVETEEKEVSKKVEITELPLHTQVSVVVNKAITAGVYNLDEARFIIQLLEELEEKLKEHGNKKS